MVVAANQAGNTNFLPAVQATQSLTVNSGVTSTTLAVLPSNSVVAGTVATLTATVKPSAVTQGVVLFCNALAARCSQGLGLYGAVSLSTSGTAVLKMKLPVGVNNVQAVFVATSVNAASTCRRRPLLSQRALSMRVRQHSLTAEYRETTTSVDL